MEQKSMLCPYKRITEKDYSGRSGKTTLNERFAPCALERCMAYDRRTGKCKRVEGEK